MKFLFTVLFFLNIAFAQNSVQTPEQSVFSPTTQENPIQESSEQEDQELNEDENALIHENSETFTEEESYAYLFEEVPFDLENKQSNTLYAKFINYPTTVYTSQRFALEIETLITTSEFTKIERP